MDAIGPEGDVYLVPANMTPADKVAEPPSPLPAPPKPPKPGDQDDEKDDDEERAFLPLFRDHFSRALRREAKVLMRAAKRGDLKSLEEAVERFLVEEEADLRAAFRPLLESYLLLMGANPEKAAARANQAAERHCRLLRAQIAEAVAARPAAFAAAAQDLAERWQGEGEAARLALSELEHQAGAAATSAAA
jgi:hypothetical protein